MYCEKCKTTFEKIEGQLNNTISFFYEGNGLKRGNVSEDFDKIVFSCPFCGHILCRGYNELLFLKKQKIGLFGTQQCEHL